MSRIFNDEEHVSLYNADTLCPFPEPTTQEWYTTLTNEQDQLDFNQEQEMEKAHLKWELREQDRLGQSLVDYVLFMRDYQEHNLPAMLQKQSGV